MNSPAKKETVVLALGSNMGDRIAALRAGVAALAPYIDVKDGSMVYETDAEYVKDQPPFLNAALIGTTALSPQALIMSLKHLESELGRAPSFRYGPRVIDMDIIFYGDQIILTPELMVPHPRMAERGFVLKPLADIAPNMKHPQTGLTITEMLSKLPDTKPVMVDRLLP